MMRKNPNSPQIYLNGDCLENGIPFESSLINPGDKMESRYLFFDNASTTPCCEAAVELVRQYALEDYGNPSSSHALGQQAARAIREARVFFAKVFHVDPEQVVFTGSGSEADNLAVYGVAMNALAKRGNRASSETSRPPRILVSAIEHPAVRKTALSLTALGIDVQLIPVDSAGQIQREKYLELLTADTLLVSIQQVNNIMGAILPVEELARIAREKVPGVVFHTDSIQAFGRVPTIVHPSPIDLVSVSGHKIHGPKGIGALIVLNKSLLKSGLRPLVWGGEQEGGLRAGTQNAGLIAGFHAAAREALENQESCNQRISELRARLLDKLKARDLLFTDPDSPKSIIRWNSPMDLKQAVPHIVSLSVPGYPSGPLAKLLEERHCLVSTGSACSSHKAEPDPVLSAMGLPANVVNSAIRVSFSGSNLPEHVDHLVGALDDSIRLMGQLLGGGQRKSRN